MDVGMKKKRKKRKRREVVNDITERKIEEVLEKN